MIYNRSAILSSSLGISAVRRLVTTVTVLAVTTILTLAPEASAAISFNFTYTTNTAGVGFLDATDGAARKAALEASAVLFAANFPSYTAEIDIAVTSTDNSMSDTLASAGSANATALPAAGYNEIGVVSTKVLSNDATDSNGSTADGSVDVNWGQMWELGDTVVAPNFDFKSTMIHELAHAFGFVSKINQDGTSLGGETTDAAWDPFDNYVTDVSGTEVINDANFNINTTLWNTISVGGNTTGGLFFSGPNAMAANGGNRVGIYSPTTWSQGSSGSHLDDDNTGLAGLIMLAAANPGPSARTFSAIELGIFTDLGFSVLIPEPSTYVLFIAMIAGVFAYNRRKHATPGKSSPSPVKA